eukprot:5054752-Prymnesium_polylepis.1
MELRRLWTRSIVVNRTLSRGVSSWALSHKAVVGGGAPQPHAKHPTATRQTPHSHTAHAHAPRFVEAVTWS